MVVLRDANPERIVQSDLFSASVEVAETLRRLNIDFYLIKVCA